jgi:transcriptional pleiotropic regulator of transition state genes
MVEVAPLSSTGMARKIDSLGRVVLPAEMRKQLGLETGDLVAISLEDDRVTLEKIESRCVFCSATTELREFADKLVCASCVERLTAG